MPFEQNISVKRDLPPGTPLYIGDTEPRSTEILEIRYGPQCFEKKEILPGDRLSESEGHGEIVWLQVSGLSNVERIQEIGELYEIHPLAIEDILNTKGRSKFEEYDGMIFIVLDCITKVEPLGKQQVSLILQKNRVISFCESDSPFQGVTGRISQSHSRIRNLGADYLVYTLIDSVVDSYFEVLERFEDRFEILEDEVIEAPYSRTVHRIQSFRQDLMWIRRKIWSIRDLIQHFDRTDNVLVSASIRHYLHDVYDHAIKIIEDTDVYREMAEGLMEIYLSSISYRSSEVQKLLTIVATIFIPLTFIAGVYGMNFKYMPELDLPLGYPLTILCMGTIGLVMIGYFKKKGWI